MKTTDLLPRPDALPGSFFRQQQHAALGRILAQQDAGSGGRAEGTGAPVRAGDVVLAALRSQVDQLRVQEPRVRREIPGAVTLMRVVTRKLRSILHGFSRILDSEHTEVVAEELKWLGAQLAAEQDTETMTERFTHVIGTLPENMIVGPVATDLERALGQLAEEGERTIMAALESDRYPSMHNLLNQLLDHPPLTYRAERPALTELPKAVAKAYRKLDRRLDTAAALPPGPDRDAALHEARKIDKQLRYMTDVVAPVIGKPATRLRRQTKKLQDLLGEYQDAVVARSVLQQLATVADEQDHSGFTYGVLYALEDARMVRVLSELPKRLERLRDERTLSPYPT
jgi:CHAD domain-containing protein